MERPRLRKLIPSNNAPEEGGGYTVRDPLGLSPAGLSVTEDELALMRLFSGQRTCEDIARLHAEKTGRAVETGEVRRLARRLEENLMLEGPAAREAAEQATQAFRAQEDRPFRHGPECYPAEGPALLEAVRDHGAEAFGPDGPPAREPVTGLFAPHIDISIAGPAYASAYVPAARDEDRDLFLVLATAHFRDTNLFILTDKDYQTPLGPAVTDRDAVRSLEKAFPGDLRRDELIHAVEHSVEFQAVYLRAVLQGRRPFTIVPVLVSSFARFLEQDQRPGDDPHVSDFLACLSETLAPRRERLCVIAGVDLAHVGRKFGDDAPDDAVLADLEKADRRSLALAAATDAEGFWDDVTADGNARKVCGLAPMYCALRLLEGHRGRVTAYGRDYQPGQGYVVTYAGMVFGPGDEQGCRSSVVGDR